MQQVLRFSNTWLRVAKSLGSPWAKPQNFAYWYHPGWQGLVDIFNYLCMSSLYFDMIAHAQC